MGVMLSFIVRYLELLDSCADPPILGKLRFTRTKGLGCYTKVMQYRTPVQDSTSEWSLGSRSRWQATMFVPTSSPLLEPSSPKPSSPKPSSPIDLQPLARFLNVNTLRM